MNQRARGFRARLTRRRIVIALVVMAMAAAVALALRPTPTPAEIVTVSRGPMQVTLNEEGETRVRDRFVVSAPLAGRVLRIELEPGDPVIANRTSLATFRPMAPGLLDVRTRAELQARVAAAEAALNRAKAEEARAVASLAQAERDVQRSRELAEAGAIAQDRLEAAELSAKTLRNALEAAHASVLAAEAELRMARASLIAPASDGAQGGTTIVLRSPIDGVVLKRLRESEAIVPQGEPLLEIGDVSKLEIVADFLSTDAVRIREGQRTLVERWGGGEIISARVRRVEPSGFTKVSALGVEEQRVNVIIDFDQPRHAFARLGDRYRVEVRVVVWEEADVITMPISSLVRDGDQWSVFVVRDGRAMRMPVEIGQRNDTEAQVLKGLSLGVQVIAFPSDDIREGTAVRPLQAS
jgi:HlyD family secretion protein